MSDTRTGQVAASAAEIYDECFVPALFAEWAPRVCDAALINEGDRVLDVACGTGVLAREAARRTGAPRSVAGVDVNDGMLAVARRHDPSIRWERGAAESLPFDDGAFDAVVSQFGLMFFVDPDAAIHEMARVARSNGRLAVAVWCPVDRAPGYAAMVGLLDRLFGSEAADALRAPYSMGEVGPLLDRFRSAGLDAAVTTMTGTARFPSLEWWLHTEIRGWTLAEMIDDEQFERLRGAAPTDLASFERPDGTVAFDHPAHVVTATVR